VLSPTRDARAAAYFFRKLLGDVHTVAPRVINVDGNAAYPAAFNTLQEEGALAPECELRPVKYLNNIVEQDHRFMCCAPLRDQTPGARMREMRSCFHAAHAL
jgi:transposase-like protein